MGGLIYFSVCLVHGIKNFVYWMLDRFRFQTREVFHIVMNCFSKGKWKVYVFIKTKNTRFHRKAGGVQYIFYMSGKKDEVGGETDETVTQVTVWDRLFKVIEL